MVNIKELKTFFKIKALTFNYRNRAILLQHSALRSKIGDLNKDPAYPSVERVLGTQLLSITVPPTTASKPL